MNDAEFNRSFDAAFELADRDGGTPVPDYRPSWLRLQATLVKRRRSKVGRARLARLAVVVAALLVGALAMGGPSIVKAIQPMYAKLIETPSGVLSFVFGRDDDGRPTKAKTSPPVEDDLGHIERSRMVVTDLAGAAEAVSFAPPVFGYIPVGYSLDRVQLYYDGNRERANRAAYLFSDADGRVLAFTFKGLNAKTGASGLPASEGVTVRKVRLKDGTGILASATNGSTRLETVSGGVYIALSGMMTEEDAVKIYDEMTMGT